MSTDIATNATGWARPESARKAHYFIERESLCGRWWFSGPLSAVNRWKTQDLCVICEYRIAALKYQAPAVRS